MSTDSWTDSWNDYFLKMVDLVASKSKDESAKIGAVIVNEDHAIVSTGYNGLPRGCNDDTTWRQERPLKYAWFEHAERNAIYNAARHGIKLKGCTMYVRGGVCCDCARGIIQTGITLLVVGPMPNQTEEHKERWRESVTVAFAMMNEAGVKILQQQGEGWYWYEKGTH